MPSFRVDFQVENARGVHLRWRRDVEPFGGIPWADLGNHGASPVTVEVPDVGRIDLNARPLDDDLYPISPGVTIKGDTKDEIANREDLDDLESTDPNVEQDGPVLTITPTAPAGEDPDEYEVEVRVSSQSVSAPEDAIQVGFASPGEPILAHACPGVTSHRVHHRLVRREDGRATDWSQHDFETGAGAIEGTVGHTNDFASGTIVDLIDGFTPAEVSGGDLQALGISLDDFGNVPGPGVALDDLADVSLLDLGPLPTRFSYRTPNVTLAAQEDLQFQVCPDLTSHGSIDFSLDAFGRFPLHWLEEQVAGFVDQRLKNMGATLDGDAAPVVMGVKVATSTSASPTFTASDFKQYRPGEVRKNVRTYAVQADFTLPFGGQLVVDKIDVRHWIYCKSRPWCHVSDAFELIHEEELGSASDQFADVALIGADWDEVLVQVDWTTAAATITLDCHFNGDGAKSVTLSQASLAGGGREVLEAKLYPKTGANRIFEVFRDLQYDGANWARQASAIDEWADTSTVITSLRFVSSNTPTNGIAAGSKVRVYGKRYQPS